jgi:hypothetical protein
MRSAVILLSTFALSSGSQRSEITTYAAVVAGMKCSQTFMNQMDCVYHVGKSLEFVAAGVGMNEAVFTIYRANSDGDYYISAGGNRMPDCAIVKPGKTRGRGLTASGELDFAFVSPRTGKVFRQWNECIQG